MNVGKKRAVRAMALLGALVLCLLAAVVPVRAAEDGARMPNRYNVVLVTDASGSMDRTDPEGYRFEAMRYFVSLMALEGNNVGAVSFGEGVPLNTGLTDLPMAERAAFVQQNADVALEDWTNIGEGLKAAVDTLDAEKNESLPSIIVLLSDGNTDMPNGDALEASLDAKSEAIERARQEGYKVYTTSLNANGEADSAELQQIAQATGGEFREVTNAADLKGVYELYQQIIFNSIATPGDAEGTFDIAKIGVEEVNIAITGVPTELTFVSPSGKTVPQEEITPNLFSSETLTVVKIIDPEPGTWNYKVADVGDDSVSVDVVRNTDVEAKIAADVKAGEIATGDTVNVTVTLEEAGKPVAPDIYRDFSGSLSVTDATGNEETVELTAGDNGFTGSYDFTDRGSYFLSAQLKGEGYELATDQLSYTVGNAAPKANDPIQQTVYLWPFMDNTATIDLTPGASDSEDENLTYEVESSAFMPDEYEIDGSNLVMKSYSLSQGSFAIKAIDSDGAACTFNVQVTAVNVGLLTLIAIGVGVAVFLVVAGILLWIALNKRFYGPVYVRPFNNDDFSTYYEEVKREKGRGRIKLSAFGCETFGIDPKGSYFQASGKDFVTFVSKAPVYGGGAMVKKVTVSGNGYEVTIASDQSARKGIIVRFESRKVSAY